MLFRISRILFQAAEMDLTLISSPLKLRFSLRMEVWRVIMVVNISFIGGCCLLEHNILFEFVN